jgi:predicted nucleic acid-binding Zn ribbon protein
MIMPHGHCPTTSQVTAVDDQFGTHTIEEADR